MAMPTRTLIVGNDGANVLQGGASAELIYGFDPNGPQGNTSAIAATRVAAGLAEPVFATAPPGDVGRDAAVGPEHPSTPAPDRRRRASGKHPPPPLGLRPSRPSPPLASRAGGGRRCAPPTLNM